MAKENNEPNPNDTTIDINVNADDVVEKFGEIKERYETELSEKDKEIEELKAQLKAKEGEVDTAIQDLNNEVNEKLQKSEELKKLQADVNELLHDKAEALVDKYIQQGKLVPAQRDKALDMCLTNQDMFISLYENAPSIVDTTPKPKSQKVLGNLDTMVDYLKS